MLLVVTYSTAARTTLRNVCRSHEETVRRRLGRAALFRETAFAGFLACRLRAKHGDAVQVERTEPFNEFRALRPAVHEAATAYEAREEPSTPYDAFASGTDHPSQAAMREEDL